MSDFGKINADFINKMIDENIYFAIKYSDLYYLGLDEEVIKKFTIDNYRKFKSANEEEISNIYLDLIVQNIKTINPNCLSLVLIKNYIETINSTVSIDKTEKDKLCKKALKILKESMTNKNYKLSYMVFDQDKEIFDLNTVSYDKLERTVNKKESKRENVLLNKIEEKIQLERLFKNIPLYNLDVIIKRSKDIDQNMGNDFLKTVLHNTIKKEDLENKDKILKSFYGGRIDKILANEDLCMKLSETDTYRNELCKVIRTIPDCIDFEKALIFSAFINQRRMEFYDPTPDEIKDAREEMQIVKELLSKNIKGYKNTKILCFESDTDDKEYRKDFLYTYNDLKNGLERFIGGTYLSDKKIEFFKSNILSGKILLSDFPKEVLKFFDISEEELKSISNLSIDNKIYLLNNKSEEEVRKELFEQEKVSAQVVKRLLEVEKINGQDIINLFLKEKINLVDIQNIKEFYNLERKVYNSRKEDYNSEREDYNLEKEISNKKLFELYLNSQKENASDDEIKDFNRYVLLYKELKLKGKNPDQIKDTMNDCISEIIENYDIDDEKKVLKDFYDNGIISADILFEWGDQVFINELIINNQLKRADIKKMYSEKDDTHKKKFILVLKETLKKMSNTEKLNYIYSLFDDDTQEDIQAREELEQLLYMDTEKNLYGSKGKSRRKRIDNNDYSEDITSKNVKNYITIPRARWKLISLLDKNYDNELLYDGHSLFKLPNVNNGEVVIEKLYDTKGENVIPSYGAATYVLPEEEFVSNNIIIEENRKKYVDRKKLMELAKNGKAKKFVHSLNWGKSIKEYFGVEREGSRYTKEDINEIDKAIKSIENSRQQI